MTDIVKSGSKPLVFRSRDRDQWVVSWIDSTGRGRESCLGLTVPDSKTASVAAVKIAAEELSVERSTIGTYSRSRGYDHPYKPAKGGAA